MDRYICVYAWMRSATRYNYRSRRDRIDALGADPRGVGQLCWLSRHVLRMKYRRKQLRYNLVSV